MSHLRYLRYVLRHKYYVLASGLAMARMLNSWTLSLHLLVRCVVHDWSKFLPSEWFAYVNYFYEPPQLNTKHDFNVAWLHHQRRNLHHHQYWLLKEDSGETLVALPMPQVYLLEMLADWRGAGLASRGKDDIRSWYETNKHTMILHPDTRAQLEWWMLNSQCVWCSRRANLV